MLNTITSDYLIDNRSRPIGDTAQRRVLWDRRLFSRARERAARWTHTEMNRGLRNQYVDATFIGRRGHASESRSFAEAARLAYTYTCAKLDAQESDPVDRMSADSARIHAVTFARKKTDAGVRGAQDGWAMRTIVKPDSVLSAAQRAPSLSDAPPANCALTQW